MSHREEPRYRDHDELSDELYRRHQEDIAWARGEMYMICGIPKKYFNEKNTAEKKAGNIKVEPVKKRGRSKKKTD